MPLIDKVRLPKARPPEPTPKEKAAWEAFIALVTEQGGGEWESVPPIVMSELDRLCARGNPLALRFKERLSVTQFQPRRADEQPSPPPPKRRIAMVKWGKPGG